MLTYSVVLYTLYSHKSMFVDVQPGGRPSGFVTATF